MSSFNLTNHKIFHFLLPNILAIQYYHTIRQTALLQFVAMAFGINVLQCFCNVHKMNISLMIWWCFNLGIF